MTTSKDKYEKTKVAALNAISRFQRFGWLFLAISISILSIVLLGVVLTSKDGGNTSIPNVLLIQIIVRIFKEKNTVAGNGVGMDLVLLLISVLVMLVAFVPFAAGRYLALQTKVDSTVRV